MYLETATKLYRDEWVERCKSGDHSAYRILYDKYAVAMYNTCLRILNNVEEAEDVLQESFTEAFRNLHQFEYRTSFGGWLKTICVNRSINQLRKRKVDWVDIDRLSEHAQQDIVEADEQAIELSIEKVKKAMMLLPDGYRTVLNLYLFEGYDHEEIAEILQVATSTTRSQYIRAKQKLVQLLTCKS